MKQVLSYSRGFFSGNHGQVSQIWVHWGRAGGVVRLRFSRLLNLTVQRTVYHETNVYGEFVWMDIVGDMVEMGGFLGCIIISTLNP